MGKTKRSVTDYFDTKNKKMEINKYRLYCSNCKDYVEIKSNMVVTTYDSEEDAYLFESGCPKCYSVIINSRKR